MIKEWQNWPVRIWSQRLLHHFFLIQPGSEWSNLPIVNLLVTAEELAFVTNDASADPKEVRDAFVAAILDELPEGKDLVEHAMDLPFSPAFPDVLPECLAHLFLSCIAAAESSAELANEGSYRERLRQLSNGRTADRYLHFLRDLWERLRAWLASPINQVRYRQLVLPDLGSHTRIGYSEGLAFPDRKDQRELSGLVRSCGFSGETPPPAPILALVGKNTGLFKENFVAAFRDFRDGYQNGDYLGRGKLRGHRFWSAVVEATLRGRDREERSEPENAIDLVVSFDGEELEMLLLAAKKTIRTAAGWEVIDLESPLAEWKCAVVDSTTHSCRQIVSELLAGNVSMRRLSALIKQGFMPLTAIIHDYLGVAYTADTLRTASHAFVRDDLIVSITRAFGGQPATCEPPASGWSFLEDLKLDLLESGNESSADLDGIWVLHPHLLPPRITLRDGIRSDDGWIGYPEVLPSVLIEGATYVTIAVSDTAYALTSTRNGEWQLPFREITGAAVIYALQEDRVLAKQEVQFLAAPALESYKRPRDLYAFFVECVWGTQALGLSSPFSETDSFEDFGVRTGRVLLLGAGQGEFVGDESSAAWKIVRTGSKKTIIFLPESTIAGQPPTTRADVARLRRRWRTYIDQSTPSPVLTGRDGSLTATKKILRSGQQMPSASYPNEMLCDAYTPNLPLVADEVTQFIAATAGRGSARAGLPMKEWRSLMAAFLHLPLYAKDPDRCMIDALTRCWAESNYIDVVSSARWRSRLVFPILPALILFRCGSVISGTLIGMTLWATIENVRRAAISNGVEVEERYSPCRLVPAALILTATHLEAMNRVSMQASIPIRWLGSGKTIVEGASIERGKSRPSQYDKCRATKTWSLSGKRFESTEIILWGNERFPSYWACDDGSDMKWSYDKNAARLFASQLAGVNPFLPRGEHEIVVEHAYLPLALAKYVSIVSPTLPGPESLSEGGYKHIYSFGTRQFRDEILAAARQPLGP